MLREPLLHFFLLGAGLFALHAWLRGSVTESPDVVVVGKARIEQLALGFERVWQRAPTEAELAGLVDDFVREEIYYREALAMGLDDDDTIVRRRMRQKLEFLAEDLSDLAEPTDAELERWLSEHAEEYRVEPRVALRQVYVSRERRGDEAEEAARVLLARLRSAGPEEEPRALGDPSLLPAVLPLSSQREIARSFGDDFAASVMGLDPERWSGPVESAYGLHLVRVEARVEARMPALAEVRDAVRRDLVRARRDEAEARFYEALRSRYRIEIEWPGAAQGGA